MLTGLGNARVKDVVRLRTRRHRDRRGRFLIEGRRELASACRSGFAVEAVYYCEALWRETADPLLGDLAGRGVPCEPTSRPVFEKMSYRDSADGWLGVAPTPDLSLASLPVAEDPLWLVAAGIEKPGNLGAMLRGADAAGATGVLVADPATDVFNPNVVRASVGTLFTVPLAVADAAAIRAWLAGRGIRTLAATPSAAVDYTACDLRGALAVVVGSEHAGLGEEWLAGTTAARISMAGRADSVNAAMAATILLFEARRQRLAGAR